MDEDRLKDLFNAYEPPLSDDELFMSRLTGRINSVEMIKQHNAALRRQTRRAVIFAAIAGFIAGIVFIIVVPYLVNAIADIADYLPDKKLTEIVSINANTVAWAIAGLTSVLISMNAYDLSLSFMKMKGSNS